MTGSTYFIEYYGTDHRGVSFWSCDEHETCESINDVVRELGDKCPEDPMTVRIRECDEDGRWRWVTDKALRAWCEEEHAARGPIWDLPEMWAFQAHWHPETLEDYHAIVVAGEKWEAAE